MMNCVRDPDEPPNCPCMVSPCRSRLWRNARDTNFVHGTTCSPFVIKQIDDERAQRIVDRIASAVEMVKGPA